MRKFCAVGLVLLASVFFANDASAQQRRITGRVTATGSGEPLSNVAVNVVGTPLGTYTGEDGSYQLLAPEGDVALLVRRVGYKRNTVRVAAGQNEANVALERDILQLETQVITGQTTNVARLNAANAVSQVSGEELNRAPTPTVENALQGKVAGATITQNSGAPGGGVQIRMRGVTSILGASDPLYVIDGVVVSNDVIQPGTNAVLAAATASSNASSQDNGVNRIADINPNDIENIEILKGASASAIYGSKASNGVVIITTKRGTSGRPRIQATQRFGTYTLANKLDIKRFSLAEAYAFGEDYGVDSATVLRNYNSCGGFCDIQEQLYGRNDLSYETAVSIQGGTEATKYFVSGLAKHDGSIQNNAGYDKQSLRVNLNQLIGSKLTLDARANLVHSLTKRSLSNNDNVNVTPFFVIPSTPSFMDLRPVNGRYPRNPFTSSNPIETLDKVRTPEDIYRLIGSASATYSVFTNEAQSLQLRLDGGVDHFSQTDNVFSPRDLQFEPADLLPGTATFQNGNNLTANVNLSATHTFFPASKLFTLTTSGGVQREFKDQKVANIVTRDVLGPNVQQGASVEAFDFRQQSRDLAFFAQEEVLAFEERLLLTAALRGQRSTVNGDPNHFYTFPKFAASYRLPTLVPRVDELKLRAAWGQAGNQPLFDSKFTPSLVGVYNGQVGVQVATRRGNPDIRPEKQTEIEGGVDITALDSRLSLTVTGYQKTITDMLLRPTLAPSTGYLTQDINAGELRNRGLEIELGATPVQYGDFTWISRTTFARNTGKVISLPDIVGRVQCLNTAGTGIETTNQLRCPRGFTAGAFGFFYGQGRIQEGASPTQIVGQDTIPNGGGATYLRKFGDTEPDFSMGFSNEFLWRGFRLYGLLDWRKGGKIVNLTESVFDDVGTNADQAGADRRHELGDLGISPYIEDAGFVKLREISLSYEIPGAWASRVTNGLARSLQIELAGRNLATWTDYNGLDPEVSNFGNQNIVRNQDLAPFPPSRSFFVSLNFGF